MNGKSWVGQWLALMFGGALIICVFIYMLALAIYGVKILPPDWFIGLAIGFVGVHRVSREVEKRKE